MRRNLIANVVGTLATGLVSVALVPLYVHSLGVEAFGLLAFYASLIVIVTLLDAGLGTAVNREVATTGSRAAVRAAQPVYLAIAATVGAAVWVLAPWLATHWFSPDKLDPHTVILALRFMAAALALRFPYGLFAAALLGAQRHVPLNAIVVSAAVARAAAAVIVLRSGGGVVAIMIVEVVVNALQTIAVAAWSYRTIPAMHDVVPLRALWAFASNAAAIGILSGFVLQVDKLVVSKVLPLATFGGYAVAVTIGVIIPTAVQPFHASAFPRLSQLVAAGETREAERLYSRATQAMAAIVFPLGVMATVFARELIAMWSGSVALANEIHFAAMLIIAGSTCYAMTTLLYTLQLAHGWMRPSLILNIAALCVLLPASAWSALRFGASGPAATWFAVQAAVAIADPIATHRRLMRDHRWRWWTRDVAPPLIASLVVAIAGRALFDLLQPSGFRRLALLGAIGIVTLIAAAVTTEHGPLRRTDRRTPPC